MLASAAAGTTLPAKRLPGTAWDTEHVLRGRLDVQNGCIIVELVPHIFIVNFGNRFQLREEEREGGGDFSCPSTSQKCIRNDSL